MKRDLDTLDDKSANENSSNLISKKNIQAKINELYREKGCLYHLECMRHFAVGVLLCILAYLFIASHIAVVKTLLDCSCLFCHQNCKHWHWPSVFGTFYKL